MGTVSNITRTETDRRTHSAKELTDSQKGQSLEQVEAITKYFKKMKKVATANGYDYYAGKSKKGTCYNLVPTNEPAPAGGYYNSDYICKIKQVPNIFNK